MGPLKFTPSPEAQVSTKVVPTINGPASDEVEKIDPGKKNGGAIVNNMTANYPEDIAPEAPAKNIDKKPVDWLTLDVDPSEQSKVKVVHASEVGPTHDVKMPGTTLGYPGLRNPEGDSVPMYKYLTKDKNENVVDSFYESIYNQFEIAPWDTNKKK